MKKPQCSSTRLAFTLAAMTFFVSPLLVLADKHVQYDDYVRGIESFNAIQREADMPLLTTLSFTDWLAQQSAAQQVSASSSHSDSLEDRAEKLRQWNNAGISTDTETLTIDSVRLERRDRLYARSHDDMLRRRQELDSARAILHAHNVAERALLPDGRVIGLIGLSGKSPRFNISHNAGVADTISVDELWPGGSSGFDLSGTNVIIGIWDDGDVLTNHIEFVFGGSSRVINQDGTSPLPVSIHPTAVAGTLAARGAVPDAKGMSFEGTLWAYDWEFDTIEMNSAFGNDVRISNHSYGRQAGWGYIVIGQNAYPAWWGDIVISDQESHWFGWYDDLCQTIDDIAYGNPYSLQVWSAGNERTDSAPPPGTYHYTLSNGVFVVVNDARPDDYQHGGYDTIPDRGVAKNVLTVGAVHKIPGGYSGTQTVSVAAFTSFGPTDDGRIKPDLAAPGVDVYTPVRHPGDPNHPGYYITSISGTSFSSPAIAGTVGLLLQMREQINLGRPYWASTLKGLLIHTADDVDDPGPDYRLGWGIANAERAAQLMQADADDGNKQYIKEVMLVDGDYIQFPVTATGMEPLKVTICWTDPAGPIQPEQLNPTNLVLINDLDLRVVDSMAHTNKPWILDPANPSHPATTGDNHRDNVEQVVITNAVASNVYTVIITHKGLLVDDLDQPSAQGVSIILSGIEPEVREELRITDYLVDATDELIHWPSVVGQNYRVQSSTNLIEQVWTNTGHEVSATKIFTTWEHDSPGDGELRFFRLVETN